MTTTSRTLAAWALVAVTAAVGAAPQQPQQPVRDNLAAPTGTGVLSGVVIADDSSGRPLRRAQVRISGGDIRVQPVTLTDSYGRFIFANLPPGRFSLSAWKAGYVTTYYGAKKPGISALGLPIALVEGQQVTNLQVKVLHGAVITGTLRDENGRPMPLTSVAVSGARLVGGRVLTEFVDSSGSSQTDDRGVYRVYGLAPGGYVVAASSFSGGNTTQRTTTDDEVRWAERRAQAASQIAAAVTPDAAGPPPPQGRPVAYTAVYFPGVVDPQTATIVTLGAGEERGGVDFALRLVPTAKQDGVVIGLDGQPAATAQVRLTNGVGQGSNDLMSVMALEMLMSMSRVNIGGKFSFPALKPGEYTISARASSKAAAGAAGGRGAAPAPAPPVMDLWAEAPITVDGNDLPDLTLTLQPGMTITGRVVFEGAIPPPDITRVRVALQLPPTTGLRLVGAPQAAVNADGSFELAGVTPGAYRIDAFTPGFALDQTTPTWNLRSASLKGQNLTDLPFDVRPNESLSGVTVTFTDKTTEVSGTLFDSAGRPAPDYYVMVYPADRKRWFQTARSLRAPVRPDSTGKYTIRGLPSGDYYICALPDFEQNTLYDPSFLEQLVPASIKLSLVEGEKKTQNMKLAGGGGHE